MTMLAVILHGPNDLRVERIHEPELPQGGLLIDMVAVGICGSDVRNWRHGSHRLHGPQVLGHEVAGVVRESDTEAFPVGTRVAVCPGIPCLACRFCARGLASLCPNRQVIAYDLPGGMAERLAIPAAAIRSRSIVSVPPSIELEIAPLAETLHTVLNGQDRAAIGPGDRVLVLGLGPVGVLHAAVAASRGARQVIAVDPLGERVAQAAAILGPGAVMRLEPGWEERAGEQADGEGWDVVIVANAAPAAVEMASRLAAPAGRILAFAGIAGPDPIVGLDMARLHYGQLSVIGSFGGTPATFAAAIDWMATTAQPIARIITSRLPLAAAADAFLRVERGEGLKTILLGG